MAAFRAIIQGNRGGTSRLGSRASGIRASVQSWRGSIISSLNYNNKDELMINIGLANGSSSYSNTTIFYGTKQELQTMAELYRLFRAGKIKLTKEQKKILEDK